MTNVATPKPGNLSIPAARARALVGTVVDGKYKLCAVLGVGGMGTVYEVEQVALERRVAMKVLHPRLTRDRETLRRFHQEGKTAGALGHPNICEVFDVGALPEGGPYIIMEMLVGETLHERIDHEGGLPFRDVKEILAQMLAGLIAAHRRGILHRDVKPENIFLSHPVGTAPVVKILDFGLAKRRIVAPYIGVGPKTNEPGIETVPGTVVGTPPYLSPEQLRGNRDLDARVDVWACGVVLYEMLTGRRPFAAADDATLRRQILEQEPTPASVLRPALPAQFEAILARALAKSRDERYASAEAFLEDVSAREI